ncbi:MAG: glycosyltransferase family 4 protein [Candidatus Omnitrophica bacterium]|nr:glycosyltransferase family 4 protein [Candidatus Omnitrophota bacterium]MDD5238576.1 glycosyltransferase family 4 protein [Candidatus Omnitrophota bacterium]
MKVLFIVPYPTEGPSNRYRVEQYLPYLKEKGIDYCIRPFIPSTFFKIRYKKGNYTKKCLHSFLAFSKRLSDLIRAVNFDIVFIHIESFPFGPAIWEWFFAKIGKPIIYDFEDAVYLNDFKGTNKMINLLRYPKKFYQILRLSSHVIVCNKYMKDLVYPYNQDITVIPTSVDTEKFRVDINKPPSKIPVIGWIGSHTTSYYLEPLRKILAALAKKYDFSLKIIGGREDFSIPGVKVINEAWALEKEVENFQKLDIGIYPLPNDERAKAKTPFKTIQYMSVGLAAVASKIGGNIDIIQDGVNGFLAADEEQWYNKLAALIENYPLRKTVGLNGRKTVEEKFSLKVNRTKILEVITKAYNSGI